MYWTCELHEEHSLVRNLACPDAAAASRLDKANPQTARCPTVAVAVGLRRVPCLERNLDQGSAIPHLVEAKQAEQRYVSERWAPPARSSAFDASTPVASVAPLPHARQGGLSICMH